MKLIVGLGNPGIKYQSTRHNAGFMALDRLAKNYHTEINREEHKAMIEKIRVNGETIILAKPQTFMNKSGQAVKKISDYYDIDPKDIVIVYDDLDLAPGRIRVRPTGGHGGHNGIKSIFAGLGTKEFPRLRVGIGRPKQMSVVDYVLDQFETEEWSKIDQALDEAVDALKLYLEQDDIQLVMNQYN
ncbi:peptidyl-tRNA hydrolase [Halobacteroides halobius DSM 5150]|uniref:Peptidyl-tRNA hydrolase n=1 Tax=Halobacteroides halobius (strain ATCC 35273 / DSM 5150 / MD-1) TaxID=748449 RepID=L0K528_HALHC|nr:aminoacyl-tRNA hydrolase [Halobacteroides halobius]AGB40121.1 peptidyl-tRNA hydrolase [Halobacteroides halobius DSM 5150]